MRPRAHRVADRGSSLQHHRFKPAFEQVSGGGKADGTGTDDGD
jgi:hypothetical protein